ncbi:hypothetical protein HNY73_021210 [Argiope bruennichi]|uniref:Uncharacterized protein n=1 Tax=Argiope bruennichi TaxID=94029 RepID=A0A8T0EAH2_ARGBR|nr:hypothetical protein HNY73_021210 [Argiope bruennichi]
MDRANTEIFSPIRNFDEEKSKRRSDSFSKFLKGPDVFKENLVNSENLGNVDENIPVKKSLSKKSTKMLQKKTAKSKTLTNEDNMASCASILDEAFTISPEETSSLKKEKSSLASKRSKDLLINFVAKRNDKMRTNQQKEIEGNNKGKYSHSAKQNSMNLAKCSLQSGAAIVPKTVGSEKFEKTDKSSSVNQSNPLSQIQSGVLEQIINDAVESKVEGIQQLLWSHYTDLLKTIYIIKDEMEQRHASESTTMFKIIEELLEENRLLRNAILARQ